MKKTLDLMIAFRVKEVIADSLHRDIEDIDNGDYIFRDLCDGMFDEAFLLHDLETGFSCALSDAEVSNWKTVGDVVSSMSRIPEVRNYCLANQ